MRTPPLLLAVLASACLLSACVVAPYGPHRGAVYGEVYGPPVMLAPPPPQVEILPPLPFAGAIWLGGYWGWYGGRHQGMPGRWERPRPGYRWEPHRWEPTAGGGWHQRGGEWRDVR
jgi:hypothetical protein